MVGRRAAHRRRHRLHDQPLTRRGVVQPLRHDRQPRRRRRSTIAPSRSRARCPTRSCRRWTSTSSPSTSTSRSTPTRSSSYDALDGVASGQYSLTEWRSGQDWTMEKNPNWYGRRQRHRPHRVPRVHQPRRDGRGPAAGRDRLRPRRPYADRSNSSRTTTTSRSSSGLQGGFTELALNGRRRAGSATVTRRCRTSTSATPIYYAIDRDVMFERVALGLGAVGTTMSPSADPTWMPDLGDENCTPTTPTGPTRSSTTPATSTPTATASARCPTAAARSSSATSSAPSRPIAAPIREFITALARRHRHRHDGRR